MLCVQLGRRVDVVGIADVDGHGQPGARVFRRSEPLRLAHLRPATFNRRHGWLAIAGQLHQQQRRVRAEPPPPVVTQAAQACEVCRCVTGVGFTLVPQHAAQAIGTQRRDHAVVQRRQSRGGVPRCQRRRLCAGRNPVLPAGIQLDARTVIQADGVRARGPCKATLTVGVQHIDHHGVGAGFQQAGWQRIGSPLARTVLAAHGHAVHPGHVRLVDGAELKLCALGCLVGAQCHLGAVPDHAVVAGQRWHTPALPRPERGGCALPSTAVVAWLPGCIGGDGIGACCPPVLPLLAPTFVCRSRITRVQREHVKRWAQATLHAQGIAAGPGLDTRAAPRCLDQPHRNVDGLAQFTRKVETRGGKVTHGVR